MFCSETNRKVKIFAHFGCNIAQIHSYCLESIYELQFSSITRYSKLDFLWTLNGPLKLMKMARFIPNQVIRKASPQHDTTIPGVCRVMITVSFSYTNSLFHGIQKGQSCSRLTAPHSSTCLMVHLHCGKLQTGLMGLFQLWLFSCQICGVYNW